MLLIVLGVAGVVQFVAVPWIRLELKRRAARARRPQAEEIWLQDRDQLFYIDHVGPNGVSLYCMDADKQFTRWTDSWEEWEARLRARVVVYTGMKRPLGNE